VERQDAYITGDVTTVLGFHARTACQSRHRTDISWQQLSHQPVARIADRTASQQIIDLVIRDCC